MAELARECAPEAIERLAEIMRTSDSDAARVSAANAILDRAYGKPRQAMELSGKEGAAMSVVFKTVYEERK